MAWWLPSQGPLPAGMVPFPRRGRRAAKGEVRRARPAAPGCPRVPAARCGAGGSRTGTCPHAPMLGRAAWHRSCPAVGAASLGRSQVPKQSHRAISQRATEFGSTDLPFERVIHWGWLLSAPPGPGGGFGDGARGQRPSWGSWCACSTHGHAPGHLLGPNDAPAELGVSGCQRAQRPAERRGWEGSVAVPEGGAHGGLFSLPFVYGS